MTMTTLIIPSGEALRAFIGFVAVASVGRAADVSLFGCISISH